MTFNAADHNRTTSIILFLSFGLLLRISPQVSKYLSKFHQYWIMEIAMNYDRLNDPPFRRIFPMFVINLFPVVGKCLPLRTKTARMHECTNFKFIEQYN